MNRYLLLFILIPVAQIGFAQQLPQYSQYMHNQYVINPAAAGMNDYLDINLSFRQQWTGITDAPRTYYLSASSPLGKKAEQPAGRSLSIPISRPDMVVAGEAETGKRKLKHALGGLVLADQYGAFQRTFANVGYALHIPFGKTYYASVGASLGWSGLLFDRSSITLENSNDATYADFIANGTRANMFDLNLGAMIYSDKLFFGYGLYQIMQNRINLGGGGTSELSEARLKDHHYILAGYRIGLGDNIGLTPSAMLKNQGPAPLSFDVNLRFDYQRKFWLAAGYRHQDAVVAMLGVTLADLVRVGYSYDYTLSQLTTFSNGSHEIVLGLMLFKK